MSERGGRAAAISRSIADLERLREAMTSAVDAARDDLRHEHEAQMADAAQMRRDLQMLEASHESVANHVTEVVERGDPIEVIRAADALPKFPGNAVLVLPETKVADDLVEDALQRVAETLANQRAQKPEVQTSNKQQHSHE